MRSALVILMVLAILLAPGLLLIHMYIFAPSPTTPMYTPTSTFSTPSITPHTDIRQQVLNLVEEIMRVVEEVRNLSFAGKVDVVIINSSWALQHWAPKEEQPIPPEMIYREVLFKSTLLLPLNYSIVKGERSYVAMFLAATAGTTLYINTDYFNISNPSARNVIAHELTHVLQFIHFPDIFRGEETTDSMLAKQALIEGDAGFVQRLYCLRTGLCTPSPRMGIYLADPYIALETFPYVYGETFVYALYNASGGSWRLVNLAYTRPPIATSMVMHPEKYINYLYTGDKGFEEPAVSCNALGEKVYGDRLGEYYIVLVLAQRIGLDEAFKTASSWHGDKAILYKFENTTHVVWTTCWNITWASREDAVRFYQKLVQSLGNATSITEQSTGVSESMAVISRERHELVVTIMLGNSGTRWVFIHSELIEVKK
ncbi:MAG: DUF4157 domain-containing protein [Ignisphaera sp.]|nr:DUF4157 domain-containing protein [Ignisphaera sp.]